MYNASLINSDLAPGDPGFDFEQRALALFRYQYDQNSIYQAYCNTLKVNVNAVHLLHEIPFLPISFFKTHRVTMGAVENPELLFESSGTTGEIPSRHYVADAAIYERSLLAGFEQYYGSPAQYAILALLPSYLERKNASLVHMAQTLMTHSGHADNGFYINEWQQLSDVLQRLEDAGQKTLLLGVTFALLDFAAAHPLRLRHTVVMETGGMKGRRQEMTRGEVHAYLKGQFGLGAIHSEYGMTELLSQAYAAADGLFSCTGTIKVLVRDINDPLDVGYAGQGGLNIVDLANIHSCAFVATDDIGHVSADGTFEVLGRLDHSALRGCSLMAL